MITLVCELWIPLHYRWTDWIWIQERRHLLLFLVTLLLVNPHCLKSWELVSLFNRTKSVFLFSRRMSHNGTMYRLRTVRHFHFWISTSRTFRRRTLASLLHSRVTWRACSCRRSSQLPVILSSLNVACMITSTSSRQLSIEMVRWQNSSTMSTSTCSTSSMLPLLLTSTLSMFSLTHQRKFLISRCWSEETKSKSSATPRNICIWSPITTRLWSRVLRTKWSSSH